MHRCFLQDSSKAVHITFDNSDGRQQTLTGPHTTHHTTGTIFQPSIPGDKGTLPYNQYVNLLQQEKKDYGSYAIPKKRADPATMPDFKDKFKDSALIEDADFVTDVWICHKRHVSGNTARNRH